MVNFPVAPGRSAPYYGQPGRVCKPNRRGQPAGWLESVNGEKLVFAGTSQREILKGIAILALEVPLPSDMISYLFRLVRFFG
jgi:hypothetical protein